MYEYNPVIMKLNDNSTHCQSTNEGVRHECPLLPTLLNI